jgi:hypothetical protein
MLARTVKYQISSKSYATATLLAPFCAGEILPNPYFRESRDFKGLQRLFFGFASPSSVSIQCALAVMRRGRGKFSFPFAFLFLPLPPIPRAPPRNPRHP